MKAALYCRLSIADESLSPSQTSESILNQKSLLLEYAALHHLSVYHIYIDENYSGLDRNRPAFCQMLKDAEQHLFDIILCKTQSRFTRDMELVEKYLHGCFPLWNIRFISIVDGVDTNMNQGKKLRQLNGLINEWYCEDLSENIRAVLKNKMKNGQFIGSFACYGYQKSSTDSHKLEIDTDAAQIVQRIYKWYLDGCSIAQIVNLLNSAQIVPPATYKAQKGLLFRAPHANMSKQWSASSVKRILHDETYTGTLIQGKFEKISCKSPHCRHVPADKWIRVSHTHEAIISTHDFNAVQILMEKKCKRKKSL
jgi:DNA invertase Pin-like site-specific DNA recombinase